MRAHAGNFYQSNLYYWKDGEPNNSGNEDCAEVNDGKVNDEGCGNKNYGICEMKGSSAM